MKGMHVCVRCEIFGSCELGMITLTASVASLELPVRLVSGAEGTAYVVHKHPVACGILW
jgi:hypothetical protein